MKTIIFQTSPPHTASTVLVNILYGLIPYLKDKPVFFMDPDKEFDFESIIDNDITVIKTHITDIDRLILKYGDNYNLYFISSVRKDRNLLLNKKYKKYNNVIVFSFNELNETDDNTIYDIVNRVHDRIKVIFNTELNIENAVNRIISMNHLYETIKENDFKFYDEFYHIHGSHRNRK